jgi:hypothetical protein
MITSPGRNPILNTHTDVDETFGTDLSGKLFWTRKGSLLSGEKSINIVGDFNDICA